MTLLRPPALVFVMAVLAACGADGEPERPEPRPAQSVSLSGTVSLGMAGGS